MTDEHVALYRQLSETRAYKERFTIWKKGDVVKLPYESKLHIYYPFSNLAKAILETKGAFWLPPVFDPENPERCLAGMLNGAINLERMSGDWAVLSGSDGHGFYTHRVSDDRLDLALIKAILKQEEL